MRITLGQTMPFGKHVGMTIDWIADNDPGYLVWMDEQGGFEVDPVLVETCRDAIDADARMNNNE